MRTLVRACAVLALLLSPALSDHSPAAAQAPTAAAAPAKPGTSTLTFIENAGQFPGVARFQVRGNGATLWLAEDAIWLTLIQLVAVDVRSAPDSGPAALPAMYQPRSGANIRLSFVDADPHPHIEPFGRLDTAVSYFLGNDAAKWRVAVPAWRGVRYVNLYPGIDLVLTGEGGELVPRLAVRPGADLNAVQLRIEGVQAVAIEGEALRLTTSASEAAWPLLRAKGSAVEPRVESSDAGTFEVAAPFAPGDVGALSVLTPDAGNSSGLLYSTFLGGSEDGIGDLAVDASGATYITGTAGSASFPTTPGAFDTSFNGLYSDAFVAKLNAAGSALEYATFLGGSSSEGGYSIAVSESGAAYVTGGTISADFPTTQGAFDTSYNGEGGDAFVVRLNAAGSALDYATYVGGSERDVAVGIAVDEGEAAYVTGGTDSTDFPTTPGAFDTSHNGGEWGDAFVVRLNAAGSALEYSTFLGGSAGESCRGIAVDAGRAAYVTGWTDSADFPTTAGALDTDSNGGWDAFVTKLNAAGSALDYATYLGGGASDEGKGIAVDGGGAAYIAGVTYSTDFPSTPGAFDTDLNTYHDAFVAKLNAAGSALDYATFLGGNDYDHGNDITLDAGGAAYVAGQTGSTDFPATPGAFDTTFNGGYYDAFAAKLNAAGSALDYATFLGGSDDDAGFSIALDPTRAACVTGATYSSDFPTTPGAFDTSFSPDGNSFIARLRMQLYDHVMYLPLVLRSQ